MSEWELGASSLKEAKRHYDAANPFKTNADHHDALEAAIKAAVAADPLLGAAKEMQEAIESALDYAGLDGFLKDPRNYLDDAWGVNRSDLLKLRAALAKSRGEP